jgi:hypothetical protein
MKDESLSKSFPYYYKIPMVVGQAENYKDGWDFSKIDISQEALR